MASCGAYYRPGDIVYEGKPFMRAIKQEFWGKICGCCLGRLQLKFCKGCGIMKYCGKTCQKADWAYHKFECSLLKSFSADRSLSTVLLIGNMILKLQKRNWENISEKVLNETVSFDSLRTLNSQTLENHSFGFLIENIKNSLNTYIGKKNVPDDVKLKNLIGKVLGSHINYGNEQAATALFIGLSKFALSCIPNCTIDFDGRILSVICMKKIPKNGEKLSIALSPLITSFQANLECSEMEAACKNCDPCSYCQMPYGTSPLTKVIGGANACSVILESEDTLQLAHSLAKLNYPPGVISQQKLRQLLQKQKGLLGNTNILRIRILALKSVVLNGPIIEMRDNLMELVDIVKSVWGKNFTELVPIYVKLIDINLRLGKPLDAVIYEKEVYRMFRLYSRLHEKEFLEKLNGTIERIFEDHLRFGTYSGYGGMHFGSDMRFGNDMRFGSDMPFGTKKI